MVKTREECAKHQSIKASTAATEPYNPEQIGKTGDNKAKTTIADPPTLRPDTPPPKNCHTKMTRKDQLNPPQNRNS
jgi:hypothetical protein